MGAEHLAPALASGDVDVLATPMIVAWCEAATVEAVRAHIDAASTTVGMRVRIDHVAPTAAGRTVTASARLTQVEGQRLTFDVVAVDDADTEIARGQIVRVAVDRARFLDRV